MNLLEIVIDKDKNLKVKNSPKLTIGDLLSVTGCLIAEIANQTGKPTSVILKDLKHKMKIAKVWK